MEGIGYWIFLAVLYLLSSLMKKRRQQTIGQQQDKEDPNSTDEVKPNPFQAEFLQDLFRDMKDLVVDPEEISEEEIENIYFDEEVEEIKPEKEVVVASDTMDGDFDSPSNWITMEPVQKAERLHSNISLGLATLMVISGIMIFRTQKGSK